MTDEPDTTPVALPEAPPANQADGDQPSGHERRGERLRDEPRLERVRAERDELRRLLDARDRLDVERIAADVLHNGRDVWLLLGDDLAGFRGEDGQLDPARVRDRVQAATVDRAYLRRPTANGDQGARAGQTNGSRPSWGDLPGLRGAR